jgi:hypothetical protein
MLTSLIWRPSRLLRPRFRFAFSTRTAFICIGAWWPSRAGTVAPELTDNRGKDKRKVNGDEADIEPQSNKGQRTGIERTRSSSRQAKSREVAGNRPMTGRDIFFTEDSIISATEGGKKIRTRSQYGGPCHSESASEYNCTFGFRWASHSRMAAMTIRALAKGQSKCGGIGIVEQQGTHPARLHPGP